MLKKLEVGKLYASEASGQKDILCITKIGEKFIEFIWLDSGAQHKYGDPKHMLSNLFEAQC